MFRNSSFDLAASKPAISRPRSGVNINLDLVIINKFEFEWEFYAQSASKAIFKARTYDCITYSVR